MTPRRAEAAAQVVTLRLSPQERAIAERAAAVNHQPLSTFVREALLGAAGDCLELRRRRRGRVAILQLHDPA